MIYVQCTLVILQIRLLSMFIRKCQYLADIRKNGLMIICIHFFWKEIQLWGRGEFIQISNEKKIFLHKIEMANTNYVCKLGHNICHCEIAQF